MINYFHFVYRYGATHSKDETFSFPLLSDCDFLSPHNYDTLIITVFPDLPFPFTNPFFLVCNNIFL